jgi:hypothetical protein
MSTSGDTTTSKAHEAAAGLRELADLIDQHPELVRLFDYSDLSIITRDAVEFGRFADLLGAGPETIRYPASTKEWTDRRRNFGPLVTAVTFQHQLKES